MTASTPMIGATELPGSAFAYTYDNAGNLTNDGTAAYTYDALGRTTVRGATTYGYNGDGTLVSQATSGVTTRYTQDLAAPLMLLPGASPRTPDQGNPRQPVPCAALVPRYPSGK
jgi:YD repeat-containing protein